MLEKIKNGLIVSCQALPDEPLHSSMIMGRMALAAQEGGAVGIRANTREDIMEIKNQVSLPVIGIVKKEYPDSPIYITPTLREVSEIASSGADMVAVDATYRERPHNISLSEYVQSIRIHFPELMLMADISTIGEAIEAERLGFDCISTTLVGYTPYTKGQYINHNNYGLLRELVSTINIPVIAEGNILTPEMARKCLEIGAYAVVVGGAITRPQLITKRFINGMKAD
ncbi:N-acetylmannosamine-6-phosphate 2-epimerase [Pradoshia eiseniae]|uniref:Putative N-acetylmannosamine-6-phosphate 2-epimerase n=1 Tax=Pradoshia eiseniae TaxID=2064768 RepID=A0A2S7MVQ1_9BACI|nr:N-acetylmannosamine-6-phosphate 2-epimerase [Pradoshia eiseniae]PQD93863.1 N-acetylmannosamine-6-phosphate 2-epimerase [Pradoshia eiseniae]